MIIAELIKACIKNNGVLTAYVYGPQGFGKTSYALWTAYEVLGSWDRVLDYLFFSPEDAVVAMGRAVMSGKRLPIIIMDDAGLWLDRLTWWQKHKIAFMEFFNLIRSVAASVIFTTPSEELPRQLLKKILFRVSVAPIERGDAYKILRENFGVLREKILEYGLEEEYALATGYKLKTLPSFMNFVSKEFYDVYPLHYPIFEEYEKRRREALRKYFAKLLKSLGIRSMHNREEIMEIIKEMIMEGKSRNEIAKYLMSLGIPKTTAYYYIRKFIGSARKKKKE